MIIQYNIVVTIVNLIDNSTSTFNKDFEQEITATDALLYNNYHVLSQDVYVLDMFKDEVDAYCTALGIEQSSIEIDEFEIVSLTDKTDVFFEATENNELSLKPIIKCYVYPKNEALKVPVLQGIAYDSTTIIWSWPEDEGFAHYLVEEAIDPDSGANQDKIIAQLPIGVNSYTETGLTPDTPYTRRLINYTDEQTSSPSQSVTVMTETVEISESLEQYVVPKNYDFTTDDAEREIIDERLEAFHSGIGDDYDLKVYKQMDADFYQKFKAYFELTGRRIQRERRYDQVGFHYRVCLEATETIEEQEGEVTFKLDAYPREEVTIEDYMYGSMPVNVYSKLFATIFLRKPHAKTETVEITTLKKKMREINHPGTSELYADPLGIVFVLDKTNSLDRISAIPNALQVMKDAAKGVIDSIVATAAANSATVGFHVIQFGYGAESIVSGFVDGETAKNAIQGIQTSGTMATATSWAAGLNRATAVIQAAGSSYDKYVTYFFSDGFPNTEGDGDIRSGDPNKPSGASSGVTEAFLKPDLTAAASSLRAVSDKVACITSNYGGGNYVDPSSGVGYFESYINWCHNEVPTSGNAYTWNNAQEIQSCFNAFISSFTVTTPGWTEEVFDGWVEDVKSPVEVSYEIDGMVAVDVETEMLGAFEFNKDKTKIIYSEEEGRAIIDPATFIPEFTQKMSTKSVYDLLLEAAKKTPEWAAGYTLPVGIAGENKFLIKGLFIKDTYNFADEDTITTTTFNTSSYLEDGMTGSVNVYTDVDLAGTTTVFGDDCYLVSDSNYVYIDGYTDAIIYDGPRFVTDELNAYDHPTSILMSASADYNSYLHNRKNYNLTYSGASNQIWHVIELIEKGKDIYFTGYSGLDKIGDKIFINPVITTDLVAHNDEHYESPILNYRFNLEDPEAKTPFYEILPTCDPDSSYKHIILLHVYYARNVWITDKSNYVETFGDDPIATLSSAEIPMIENIYKWTLRELHNDNGRYIDEYLWFYAKDMFKEQDYYDEIPGEGMDSMYGLVNGRYRDNNQSGKQDLVVDTPQFNIPTTVHPDTIRIYIMINEYYPDTALVSYKWENPWNHKDDITMVNGDYVTFSSDSVTYKDVEYIDVVSTINMPNQEVFDNKTQEHIYEIVQPETVYEYKNYYLTVTTDNGDVLAMRYPTEITFDENGKANVAVSFKGVVNATSQWAPRIHNGYYYLNQHEYFAYSEFNVEANFETLEELEYKTAVGYISFDVTLRHLAAAPENYNITKDTRSQLMQDEETFQWIDGKGLTLKPFIDGLYYKEYQTSTYTSPVIMFPHVLTEAGPLTVSYNFEDGSTDLPMYIRSYDVMTGEWTEWEPFNNGDVPTTLGCAYQVKFDLQPTVWHTDLFLEDYMCCYLDWKDDMNVANTTNIVTITDHMIAGPHEGTGIYISEILDFGCETTMQLDLFESKYENKCSLYIATANEKDDLLIENTSWKNITETPDAEFTGRFFRYKIEIPYGEKVYWLHKRIQTKETHALLPYLTGINMTGVYAPSDVVTNFINTEAFEIPNDGNYHNIFNRVIDVIGADVLERGYTENEIEYVKIQCTTPDIEIVYDSNLDTQYPFAYLNSPINAKAAIDYDIVIKKTPYIKVDPNDNDTEIITITKGTPQQFCPITVEDEYGNVYHQLYDVNPEDMYITDKYIMDSKEKYIELKRNDFELETVKIYLNDVLLTPDKYKIVNHLLIFNDFLLEGDKVEMVYRIAYSFHADIDRINDTTKLTIYMDKDLCQLPDSGTFLEPYEGMTMYEMYTTGDRFSCNDDSMSMSVSPTEEASWTYDAKLNTFITSANTENFNGFISNINPVDAYTHETTLKSDAGDDDSNGVIVAYAFDIHNQPHTLSFIVSRNGWCNPGDGPYGLVYDFGRPTQKVLVNLASTIDPSYATHAGWSAFPNGIRLRVEKTNNILKCKASMWNDPDTWNELSAIEFDLDSNTDTSIFSGKVFYGYCNWSQALSYYTDIDFQAYIVIDLTKKFKVYFETSTRNNKFIAKELSLNPIYRTDYKGFIYLTDEHNEPYKINIYCNPLRLKAGGYDKVDVAIEVLDIMDNPVISKPIAVDCKYGILTCEEYVTDMNGVVHLIYESAYMSCIDTLTAKVLTDDNSVIEQSISIINE